jgi:glycosyltransferase involved in cell wall biosynthesis
MSSQAKLLISSIFLLWELKKFVVKLYKFLFQSLSLIRISQDGHPYQKQSSQHKSRGIFQTYFTSMPENNFPFVSVIIPVFNDSERLKLCLEALGEQTYPEEQYEIIVVDNGSSERIEKAIRPFKQVLVVHEKRPGSYAARNKGISVARGEILAFTDSDCIPAKNWIEMGVKQLLSKPECGLVGGRIEIFFEDPHNPNAVELYDSINYLQQRKYIEEYHFGATANLFAFKEVFNEVGYFNDLLKSGGDMEWGQRVFSFGYSLLYSDDSYVAHPARKSLVELHQKLRRISKGHYQMSSFTSETEKPFLTKFFGDLSRFKPPLLSIFRKVSSEKRLQNNQQKIQVFCIELMMHYLTSFEKMRLRLTEMSNNLKK